MGPTDALTSAWRRCPSAQVARLRTSYGPSLVIHARARDLQHAIALEKAGANSAIPDASVTSLRLGARVMLGDSPPSPPR